MATLNNKGEIADFVDVSQFIPGRSAYECCAYSAALCNFAGEPGHGAAGTPQQASNLAQFWYGKEEGSTDASNHNGMSLAAMENMLQGMGLQYKSLVPNINGIRSIEPEGLPIMLCAHEDGMYDLGLGDRVPYAWTPTGNHCIVVSGVHSDGNLLVHDCANVDSNGVRPGPRVYDASKLQIVSATAVHLKGVTTMGIPSGWRDDGTVLYCPSHVQGGADVHVTGVFRDYVLNNAWRPSDRFIEAGHHVTEMQYNNTSLGSGFVQTSLWSMLLMPDSGAQAGKVIYAWLGVEAAYLRQAFEAHLAEIAQLKAELAKPTVEPAAVANRLTALAQLGHQVEALATQAIV